MGGGLQEVGQHTRGVNLLSGKLMEMFFNRLHYMASTNAGLCHGNMTWCYEVRGPQYYWVIDLREWLNHLILPVVVQAFSEVIKERAAELENQKSDHRKTLRVRMNVARAEGQEARKKWVKWQAVQHTYGQDDEEEDDQPGAEEEVTVISGKTCRCGSTSHKRTHRSCPLNNRK